MTGPMRWSLVADALADVDPWPSPAALAEDLTAGLGPEQRWQRARHLDVLDDALVRAIYAPGGGRLIVGMPPRSGKSTLTSRWTPAWFLRRFPHRKVVLATHSADYATEHGRATRELVAEHGARLGLRVSPDSKAAGRWDLQGTSGGYLAVGVGTNLTGRGANLLIIDDPVAGPEDVASPEARERTWLWWQHVAAPRLEPDATVIVVMTRWDADDLAGRLIARQPDRWTLVSLPALAEDDDDPLGRRPGEPLWPERFDAAALVRIREEVGARAWASLYQQRPVPAEGAYFRFDWIEPQRWQSSWGDLREAMGSVRGLLTGVVVAVDPAVTSGTSSDETGIVAAGVLRECPCGNGAPLPHFAVLEDLTARVPAEVWGPRAAALAESWQAWSVVVEANQGGDLVADVLARHTSVPVTTVRATVGKQLRAAPVALQYERRRVHHLPGLDLLERQMTSWLEGQRSPDRLDAAVWALTQVTGNPIVTPRDWMDVPVEVVRWAGTEALYGSTARPGTWEWSEQFVARPSAW